MKKFTKSSNSLRQNVKDLAHLGAPSEEDISSTLKHRHNQNIIYTDLGPRMLVALNPWQELPIYSQEKRQEYVQSYKNNATKKPERLSPHIYYTASNAYFHMRRTAQDQTILLMGETASGKSYSERQIVQQLIALSGKKNHKMHNKVKAMSTLIKAFGHASTRTNPDATRCGTFTEFQFNESGKMVGAKLSEYFMDKARISHCPAEERLFHVFYYLLHGSNAEEKAQWRLQMNSSQLHYLQQTGMLQSNVNDSNEFAELKLALRHFGIGKKTQFHLFSVLSAIVQLGNIRFVDTPNSNYAACQIQNPEVTAVVAEIMGVDQPQLENSLTTRVAYIGREFCTTMVSAREAGEQRDLFAQNLYELVLRWIIERINYRTNTDPGATFVAVCNVGGGWVERKLNYFEDFCMNYTSERIHYLMQERVLGQHNELFELEGLSQFAPPIRYKDNKESLTLMTKSNTCLFALLDTQTKLYTKYIEASSGALQESFNTAHGAHELYHVGKYNEFGIQHFGTTPVMYSCEGFIERNANPLPLDLINLIKGGSWEEGMEPTTNAFMYKLLKDANLVQDFHPKDAHTVTASQILTIPRQSPSKNMVYDQVVAGENNSNANLESGGKSEKKKKSDKKKITTVVSQLKNAMNDLVDAIDFTNTWFVFHYNPTLRCRPSEFDSKKVRGEVHRSGLVPLTQCASYGYYAHMTYEEFLERYAPIWHNMELTPAVTAKGFSESIKASLSWGVEDMLCGKTQAFFSWGAWRILENRLRLYETELRKQQKNFEDGESVMSDTESMASEALTSISEDDSYFDLGGRRDMNEKKLKSMKHLELGAPDELEDASGAPQDQQRERWLCLVWMLTWMIPNFCIRCCGMKRPDVMIAWREKVALCILILWMGLFVVFITTILGNLVCPPQKIVKQDIIGSLQDQYNQGVANVPNYVYMYGRVYDLKTFAGLHEQASAVDQKVLQRLTGRDVSPLFPFYPISCAGSDSDRNVLLNAKIIPKNASKLFLVPPHSNPGPKIDSMASYLKGDIALDLKTINKLTNSGAVAYITYLNEVFDLTSYYTASLTTDVMNAMFPFTFGADLLANRGKVDWYDYLNDPSKMDAAGRTRTLACLRGLFRAGVIDNANTPKCILSQGILLSFTIILCTLIIVKFLAAIQFGDGRQPESHNNFVILQVPCYTEGEESLRKTIDSLAKTLFDDKHKLLFIACDGNIVGSGNDRPTPQIVLDILGVDTSMHPDPLSYVSLGEGSLQHNMGKVYSGLYDIAGHAVPYLVVVKVGKPTERSRPGNRGKRDSQLVLMRFLNKVHYDKPMSPLELEMYHHLKIIIGVEPSYYEYCLMVDADTMVHENALNSMMASFLSDSKVMGLCGETKLANETETWATMIQVYEYFISHYLSKAFESLFGSVTCLPGCFCMYRIRSENRSFPLLVSNSIVESYSENNVNTLHLMNLLTLGEDRYLTTLMLKNFPRYKTIFVPDAKCETNAPDSWDVLLSQRRRWINSTVHNLFELLSLRQLCGFCCFSMRFVIFLDLFATLVMPVTLFVLAYMIYSLCTVEDPTLMILGVAILGGVYALQAIIFIIKGQWQHIIWMIIYLIAMPVFALFLPVYSFWHFDDFSWGNTRVVLGEDGKKKILKAEAAEQFDISQIPHKKWGDYEQEVWDVGSVHSDHSDESQVSGYSSYSDASFGGQAKHFQQQQFQQQLLLQQQQQQQMPFNGAGYGYAQPGIPLSEEDLNSHRFSGMSFGSFDFSAYDPSGRTPITRPTSMYSNGMMPYAPSPGMAGVEPSNEDLQRSIHMILSQRDLSTVTKKQVREELSQQFGMPLDHRRDFINWCIEDFLMAN